MNNRAMRQAIADALSAIADVSGFRARPTTPNVGDAWPVLAGADRNIGDAFLNTWAIRVSVPQDEVGAQDWWDDHWASIYFALKPVGYVTAVRPIVIAMQGGDHLAYEITMTAEE